VISIEAFALDFLFLSQSVESNIKAFTIEHRVVLSDAVVQNYHVQGLFSSLHLAHVAKISKTSLLSASNSLTLAESILPRVFVESITQTFFVWDAVIQETQFPLTVSQLTVIHDVVVDVAKAAYDTLELKQEIGLQHTRSVVASNTLEIRSDVNGYIPSYYFQGTEVVLEAP